MPNIKLKNVFVCDDIIISFDGKLSLIGLFSEIKTKGLPAINPKFSILVSIAGDVGAYDEKIEIVDSNEKTISSVTGTAKIEGGGGNNFLANFINVPFTMDGKYFIKVSVNNEIITNKDEHFILVKKIV